MGRVSRGTTSRGIRDGMITRLWRVFRKGQSQRLESSWRFGYDLACASVSSFLIWALRVIGLLPEHIMLEYIYHMMDRRQLDFDRLQQSFPSSEGITCIERGYRATTSPTPA